VAGRDAAHPRVRLRGGVAAGGRRGRRLLRRFTLDDGRWGLLLGDVSGKGVAAGLVASSVQGRVQTAARHAHLAPADLARALNADVFASTEGQRYATLIYGTLDARHGS
jgi:phosphoserine phosphatase RsbU/P